MTSQERNRFICEKLGLCWHERSKSPILRNGRRVFVCKHCQKLWLLCQNPDFTSEAGRIQLLKLMMTDEKLITKLFSVTEVEYHSYVPRERLYLFDKYLTLLTDDTGKLRDAAWEWMGGEG